MNNSHIENIFGPKSTRVNSIYSTEIIEKMSPRVVFQTYPTGHRITFSASNQLKIYLFRTGVISVYRQPDDILLELIEAPTLRGIIPIHASSQSVFILKAITPIEMATIDNEHFYQLITELQLWESFAKHLQQVSSMSVEILFKLISPSVFDIVRLQLYELMEKPESIREGISAESYVRGKTRVSRSAIMRVLSDLKNGGYITIENGILKNINQIPKKY